MPLTRAELERGDHRLAPDDQLRLSPMDFDPKFERPTSDVRIPLDKMHGRCGDLIVYQTRGARHAPENQQATLRSLGLGDNRACSLRWSDDEVTRGYVHTVRHFIGVVKLSQPCYKEWISPHYETQQYGTPSRPGQVWRALTGEYLGYRADSSGVALYMSTACDFGEILLRLQAEPIEMEPDLASAESWIALQDKDGGWDSRRGHYANVMDGLQLETVRRASIPIKSIGKVTAETVVMTLTWSADVQKFHDIERVSHEVGVIAVRSFARKMTPFRLAFSEMPDREACPASMSVRDQGRRFDVTI